MKARKHSGRGIAYTRSMGVTVKRAPSHPQRLVVCPDCGADVGKPCIAQTGKETSVSHVSRKRLSVRAQRGEA